MTDIFDNLPPGTRPSFDDLVKAVQDLHDAQKANALPPTLAVLQRKLEQTWQPDASALLGPASITPDMLQALAPELISDTLKVTPLRKVPAAAMTVGVSVAALDVSGLTPTGVVVVSLNPSAHHTFTWYPNVENSRIVFNNSGVAQNVDISYLVVGT